jgi:hypothetical protein
MFIAGYYSKDLILDAYELSFGSLILQCSIMLLIMVTVVYGIRVIGCLLDAKESQLEELTHSIDSFLPLVVLTLFTAFIGVFMF